MDLTRTKSVDDSLAVEAEPAEGEEHQGRFHKSLGALDLMGFGIGIVIGTGIFTLTGVAAKNFSGPSVTLSFALAGVGLTTICGLLGLMPRFPPAMSAKQG